MKLTGKRSLESKLRRMSEELAHDAVRITDENPNLAEVARIKLLKIAKAAADLSRYIGTRTPAPGGHGIPVASGWKGGPGWRGDL